MNIMITVDTIDPNVDIRRNIRECISLSKKLNVSVMLEGYGIITPTDTVQSVLLKYQHSM